MSVYKMVPSPDVLGLQNGFAYWEGGFSEFELNRIITVCETFDKFDAYTDNGVEDPALRKSTISWIPCTNETSYVYDRLSYIANQLNGQFFDFDLFGFVEDLQYTVYSSGSNDHYTWHMDMGIKNTSPRKLSLILQLSDPEEYDGGDLEFFTSNESTVAKKERGLVYAFPSYLMHRVTPVTAGTRRSLVVWIAGPKFR